MRAPCQCGGVVKNDKAGLWFLNAGSGVGDAGGKSAGSGAASMVRGRTMRAEADWVARCVPPRGASNALVKISRKEQKLFSACSVAAGASLLVQLAR